MKAEVIQQLTKWADKYEAPGFVYLDPIQFPRQFNSQLDIEISGLATAYLSFGKRDQILKAVQKLHDIMENSPAEFVYNKAYQCGELALDDQFYRMVSNQDLRLLFDFLHNIYWGEGKYHNLEDAIMGYYRSNAGPNVLQTEELNPVCVLKLLMSQYGKFARPSSIDTYYSKKLAMFLRWMVRQDSPVDIGCWERISPQSLLIPIDTHVHRIAKDLGITKRKDISYKTAKEITDFCKLIWPDDPCKGDFALFGYGINHPK